MCIIFSPFVASIDSGDGVQVNLISGGVTDPSMPFYWAAPEVRKYSNSCTFTCSEFNFAGRVYISCRYFDLLCPSDMLLIITLWNLMTVFL